MKKPGLWKLSAVQRVDCAAAAAAAAGAAAAAVAAAAAALAAAVHAQEATAHAAATSSLWPHCHYNSGASTTSATANGSKLSQIITSCGPSCSSPVAAWASLSWKCQDAIMRWLMFFSQLAQYRSVLLRQCASNPSFLSIHPSIHPSAA